MQHTLTEAIQEHYDLASPYYEKLWGKHLHHGYYQTGEESKEEAAENLIKFLVERAEIREGARVLDVGCGIGGTSAWLSERLGCEVTGITISPIQIEMATEAAWLKEEGLSVRAEDKYIRPIEEGMLVSLPTLSEYKRHIEENGLRLLYYEDISSRVSKTWDICLDIVRDRTLWRLAGQHSKEFIAFLKSFKAMRNGFKTGTFRYGVFVVEKP